MKISARNQFSGKITKIEKGAVNAMATLDVNGTSITGTISVDSADALGLTQGKEATAIVKATEVLVGIGSMKLSARNQFAGKVTDIKEGAVNGIVSINANGLELAATISMSAIKELELTVGCDAVAIVKATSVMFGIQ